MKPISQSIKGKHGNCLQACLASLLELKLADVPNFPAMKDDEKGKYPVWWLEMQAWLRQRGLCYIDMALTDKTPLQPMPWAPSVLFFGLTKNGVKHCLCGEIRDARLFPTWNPDPDAEILGVMALGLLVPLDPSKMVLKDKSSLIS